MPKKKPKMYMVDEDTFHTIKHLLFDMSCLNLRNTGRGGDVLIGAGTATNYVETGQRMYDKLLAIQNNGE